MAYVHLEKCRSRIIDTFIPKIPDSPLIDEDISINRVCVADSIEGAIGSAPWGGSRFNYVGINVPLRVYEIDEDNCEIVKPMELVKNGYVQDALCYGEHWILNEIKPKNIQYIIVTDYTEISEEYFEAEYYNMIEKDTNWEDYYDYYISDATVFKNLKYKVIDEKDIVFGYKFDIDISEIKDKLSLIDNVEEEIAYLMNDYMSSENEVEEVLIKDNKLTIITEEEEGLYVKEFMKSLKDLCKVIKLFN